MRKIITAILISLFLVTFAYAQQTNLSFTTPPIVSPTFGEGKKDMRIGLSYLTLEDDGTIPNTQIDMNGAGLNFAIRKAFSNYFAGDFSANIFNVNGDIIVSGSSLKQNATSLTASFNLEIQPFKTNLLNMILFIGPTLTTSNGDYEYLVSSQKHTNSYTMSLYGMQAGIQLGVKTGPVQFIPFIMRSSQQGDITTGGNTTTIPSFNTTTYGIEIMFFNALSLGTMLQDTGNSKNNNGITTTLYQIGYRVNF